MTAGALELDANVHRFDLLEVDLIPVRAARAPRGGREGAGGGYFCFTWKQKRPKPPRSADRAQARPARWPDARLHARGRGDDRRVRRRC